MTDRPYTEDQLVEQPAIGLFAQLGWQTVSAMEEVFGTTGTLGRETSGEVVLAPRLRAALEKLNPQLPSEAIASAVDELTRDRSAMSLAAANREVCGLLKDGVKVAVPDRERGGLRDERVRVVDWEHPAANDFLLVSQMTVSMLFFQDYQPEACTCLIASRMIPTCSPGARRCAACGSRSPMWSTSSPTA